MALDDYLEPEVGIAVALTAAVLSPPVRRLVRRGAVYGVAGGLIAGGTLTSFARGVGRGVRQAATSATTAAQGVTDRAKAGPEGQTDDAVPATKAQAGA